ncbi:MAG: alpha/beta fold hydrolase [Pseudomonadales bacterium]
MFDASISSHHVMLDGHQVHYLAAGPENGPLLIFVHGWPELSASWRHQLPVFAGLGFRAIAPDLRGYGQSTTYAKHEDYAQEHVVADLIGLLDSLGVPTAIWIGHDWGSPTVWNIASHHPQRCCGVASLCVPYFTLERGLEACIELVDRDTYPLDQFPAGQWEYQLFYQEQFARATQQFDANPASTVKLLIRAGDPAGYGKPAATAMTRLQGGWFGELDEAPNLPLDEALMSAEDLAVYAEALSRNGFFGPDSYYMNHDANRAYAATASNNGHLSMPVLFVGARYDYVCETIASRLAEPMRERCAVLDELVIDSGHWMAQEKPAQVNAALVRWLAKRLPETWPDPGLPNA